MSVNFGCIDSTIYKTKISLEKSLSKTHNIHLPNVGSKDTFASSPLTDNGI